MLQKYFKTKWQNIISPHLKSSWHKFLKHGWEVAVNTELCLYLLALYCKGNVFTYVDVHKLSWAGVTQDKASNIDYNTETLTHPVFSNTHKQNWT